MSNHLKTYLGGQVRSFRRMTGQTQASIDEAIGRTAEAVSNIETGKSLPSLDTLVLLADVFNVPITEFFPAQDHDPSRSPNRLKREAEAMTLIRAMPDKELRIALAQLEALSQLDS